MIAGVYARAALALAEEQGTAKTLLEELEILVQELDRNSALVAFLSSPLVKTDTRSRALERMFRGRLSDLLVDTLQVMNRKGRSGLLRALAVAYRRELEELRGQIRVQVKTAIPLSDRLRERLRRALAEFSDKQPLLEERVEKSLIGGVVLNVGDHKVDSSVAKELRRLGKRLLDRASHEIHSGRIYFEEGT